MGTFSKCGALCQTRRPRVFENVPNEYPSPHTWVKGLLPIAKHEAKVIMNLYIHRS